MDRGPGLIEKETENWAPHSSGVLDPDAACLLPLDAPSSPSFLPYAAFLRHFAEAMRKVLVNQPLEVFLEEPLSDRKKQPQPVLLSGSQRAAAVSHLLELLGLVFFPLSHSESCSLGMRMACQQDMATDGARSL